MVFSTMVNLSWRASTRMRRGDSRLMFVLAVVMGIAIIAVVSAGVIVLTPVLHIGLDSLNATMYREGSGSVLSVFDRFYNARAASCCTSTSSRRGGRY